MQSLPSHHRYPSDLWFEPHDVHNEMLRTRLHVHRVNIRVSYDTVKLLVPVRPAVALPAVPLYAADLIQPRSIDFLFLVFVADAVRLYTERSWPWSPCSALWLPGCGTPACISLPGCE